jgi:hypothetical protein
MINLTIEAAEFYTAADLIAGPSSGESIYTVSTVKHGSQGHN